MVDMSSVSLDSAVLTTGVHIHYSEADFRLDCMLCIMFLSGQTSTVAILRLTKPFVRLALILV